MKAKIISHLIANVSDGDPFEPHGTLQHVAHMPCHGVICQLKLGASGLQYTRAGVVTHVIPRVALVALFEKLEPKFAEPPLDARGAAAITRPKDVDEHGAPVLPSAPQASRPAPLNSQLK